jgi:tetratricopeptide (TPR) repeat protein
MRSALLVLAASLCLGCHDVAAVARRHAYTAARNLGGIDTTSLTVPVNAPSDYPASTTNVFAVRAMLRRGEFAALDSLLTAAADSAHLDYRYESRLYVAYSAFETDTSLAGPLDRWVQSEPSSAPAFIARASYRIAQGWRARGTAYARNTSVSAMQRMKDLFAAAITDLDSAVALTPRSAAAYRLRIQIAKINGNPSEGREYLVQGLKDIPASFGLRRQYMSDLIPRWGGSYDAMSALAQWSEQMADTNPRLRALSGYIILDTAEVLELARDQTKALAAFTRALAVGNEEQFHLERGRLLIRMRRYAESLQDLDAAVAISPMDPEAYLWRGIARQNLVHEHHELRSAALSDLQHAVLLDPGDDLALTSFMLMYSTGAQ